MNAGYKFKILRLKIKELKKKNIGFPFKKLKNHGEVDSLLTRSIRNLSLRNGKVCPLNLRIRASEDADIVLIIHCK
jgi:hypothetical protein